MFFSLLDNDQYNFTMQQAIMKLGFSMVPVVYKFKCRNDNVDLTGLFSVVKQKLEQLEAISLSKDEYDYMKSLRYFNQEYLNFLKYFRFDTSLVKVNLVDNNLDIRIEGPWYNTILFEVPILYIISESYTAAQGDNWFDYATRKLIDKTKDLPPGFKFADFGTRRRACSVLHNAIVGHCVSSILKNYFVGTSNLYLAKQYNIKAIGTMSHQWIQAHQQLNYRVSESQKMAFENWIKVYRGDLGYALADTLNTDAFLKDFDDPLFYKLFDGVREDSEPDPIAFGHKIVNFYVYRGINPRTKTIIYSNSLTFEKAIKIYKELHNLIGLSFGIGTNLTNDIGKPRLDIVLKMIECNGQPVAKISNEPGKSMCEDQQFVSYLKSVFLIK